MVGGLAPHIPFQAKAAQATDRHQSSSSACQIPTRDRAHKHANTQTDTQNIGVQSYSKGASSLSSLLSSRSHLPLLSLSSIFSLLSLPSALSPLSTLSSLTSLLSLLTLLSLFLLSTHPPIYAQHTAAQPPADGMTTKTTMNTYWSQSDPAPSTMAHSACQLHPRDTQADGARERAGGCWTMSEQPAPTCPWDGPPAAWRGRASAPRPAAQHASSKMKPKTKSTAAPN